MTDREAMMRDAEQERADTFQQRAQWFSNRYCRGRKATVEMIAHMGWVLGIEPDIKAVPINRGEHEGASDDGAN